MIGLIERIGKTIGGAGFAATLLSMLVFGTAAVGALVLVPPAHEGLGAFAADFRTWCFGWDPATGSWEWGYIITFIAQPIGLSAAIFFVWWEPLGEMWRDRKRTVAVAASVGMLIVGCAGAGFAASADIDTSRRTEELPFPERALRTSVPAKDFTLTAHDGSKVTLSDLRGKTVLLTAVYAHCPHTCPMIVLQTRRVLAELSPRERANLVVLGVTLDPEKDDVASLAEMAKLQRVEAPGFRLLTGDKDDVEYVLDMYGFQRTRDPETGVIDHASMWVLVDREGKLAYRLTRGERRKEWLRKGLQALLAETTAGGVDSAR